MTATLSVLVSSLDAEFGASRLQGFDIGLGAPLGANRKALGAAYVDIVTDDLPEWDQDPKLLNWPTNLWPRRRRLMRSA